MAQRVSGDELGERLLEAEATVERLIQERDEARQLLEEFKSFWPGFCEQVQTERDEAREVASSLLSMLLDYRDAGQCWGERYPWLTAEQP